jgi:hypothetical protein
MADVELTVATELSDGMDIGVIALDNHIVDLTRGKGTKAVDDSKPDHVCNYWFVGPPGGTFAFEIKRGEDSIVAKKTKTIRPGQRFGRGETRFKLS